MKAISLEYIFVGDLFADSWPNLGDDYGHIIYSFDGKLYKDSGGYLTSYLWDLLNGLTNNFQKNEAYNVTSLDGDFGLKIVPTRDEVEITIYSGAEDVYKTKMTRNEFIHFCFEIADLYFDSVLKINPKLKENGNLLALYIAKKNLEKTLSD